MVSYLLESSHSVLKTYYIVSDKTAMRNEIIILRWKWKIAKDSTGSPFGVLSMQLLKVWIFFKRLYSMKEMLNVGIENNWM